MDNLPKISVRVEKISKVFNQPTEHIQSEGEILIKNLVQKQTNTKIDLNEQLSKKKEFVSPQQLIQITDYKVGETSLDAFKKTSQHLNQIEELKFCSLNQDEIDFYLDSKNGPDYLNKKYKNLSKEFLNQRLQKINDKINTKQLENEKNKQNKNVSRHIKEFASSIKPESQETKLFNFAISNLEQKRDDLPLEHPINHLEAIEKDLFSHLDREEVPTFIKRRKIMKKLEPHNDFNHPGYVYNTKSKWDIKEIETPQEPNIPPCTSSDRKRDKVYTCQPPNYYTIKDGKILKLETENNVESLEKKEIQRLTEDEIRLNPKFKNYDKGTPSKVLYVKNIAKSGKDEFLRIFSSDGDSEGPDIKLMTGKMQGQAFITFKNENLATDALNKYNGYYIKEKPTIISYGKSKD